MTEHEPKPELEQLLKRIESLERINAALMDRVERTVNDAGSAYAMFETNIVMQQTIRERTGDLAHANDALRVEIQERRAAEQAMREARDAAEAANAAKSQFLANMSHEIRTPLTAVIGFADLIREDASKIEQVQSCAETIHRNGQHLIAVINDILDLSKLEVGGIARNDEPVDVVSVCEEIADLMQVRADEQGVALKILHEQAEHRCVVTDGFRLRQIVMHLVGNAIKFTPQGRVEIHVASQSHNGSVHLTIRVKDTGIGISKDAAHGIFDPFVQADNSMSRSFGGTGLGLAISKRFAELLDGQIECESQLGIGSTFTLSLFATPAAKIATGEPTLERHAEPVNPLCGLRVLLAEDGQDNQRLISFHLRKLGLEVCVASDGVEAIEAVQRGTQPFSAIFMDMQMPRMDGYTAVRTLRQDGYTGYIIALTAHAMAGDREKCIDSGCDDYETKPVKRETLEQAMHRAIDANRRSAA